MNETPQEGVPNPVVLGSQALRTVAALVVVVAGLKLGADILVPFLLAVFFALSLSPISKRLERVGLSAPLAISLSLILALGFILGLIWIVSDSVVQLRDALPRYQERVAGIGNEVVRWITGLGVSIPESAEELDLQPQRLMGFVSGLVDGMGQALSNSIVVVTVMLFMLFDAASLSARLDSRRAVFASAMQSAERVTKAVVDYLSMKTVISLATGVSWGIFLALVGVDFPVLWGLVAFLLNYVPNIGSPIAALPPVLLALIQFGWGMALACVAGSVVINTVFGSILEPRMMGKRLGLSTLVIFLGLVFWTWVFGPVGTVLSVPLTLVVKMSLQWTDDYRDLSLLLGPESESEPDVVRSPSSSS